MEYELPSLTTDTLSLPDIELLVLSKKAQDFDLEHHRQSVLLPWKIDGVASFSLQGITLTPGAEPLPHGFSPHSYHVGSAGVAAFVFIRAGATETAAKQVVVVYRQTKDLTVLTKQQLRFLASQATEIARAAGRQIFSDLPGSHCLVTGLGQGGRLALLVSLHSRGLKAVGFNPAPIPEWYPAAPGDLGRPKSRLSFFRARTIVVCSGNKPIDGPVDEHPSITRISVLIGKSEATDLKSTIIALYRLLPAELKENIPEGRLLFIESLASRRQRRRPFNSRSAAETFLVHSTAFYMLAPFLAAYCWFWQVPGAVALAVAVVVRTAWGVASRHRSAESSRNSKAPTLYRHQQPITELVALGIRRGVNSGCTSLALGTATHVVTYALGTGSTASDVTSVCLGAAGGVAAGFASKRNGRRQQKSHRGRSR